MTEIIWLMLFFLFGNTVRQKSWLTDYIRPDNQCNLEGKQDTYSEFKPRKADDKHAEKKYMKVAC